MAVESVLVIGGGLGGLSAAVALAKGGCRVRLIERNPDWSALGAGLTFNGATARAFKTIGVLDEVVAAGAVHGMSDICDSDGTLLTTGSTEMVFGPDVPVLGGILRPVVHRIMVAAARKAGVECVPALTVAEWIEHRDGVAVRFSDGTTGRYDLAIGADGLMSSTRAQLFPDAPGPEFTGQGCWRAIAPRPASVETSILFLGGQHKVGLNPVSPDQMYLFLLETVPDNPWYDEQDWPELLRAKLAGFGGHVATVREGLGPDSSINYRPLETLVMPRPWYRGHVLLIGDAAHATTPHVGFGAGLAIEDGVVLGELVREGLPAGELVEAFTDRRFDRCRNVVEGSVALGELEMRHAPVADQRALSRSIYEMIQEPA